MIHAARDEDHDAATQHPAGFPLLQQPRGSGTDLDFDELAAAAAQLAGVPTALVTIFTDDRLWFRGRAGYDGHSAPRQDSLCDRMARSGDEFIVPDTTAEPTLVDHPMVVGEPHVRFYAGFPLQLSGEIVGSLCVVAPEPHALGEDQCRLLRMLARQVVAQLELRRQIARAEASHAQLGLVEARYRRLAIRQFAEAQALAQLGSWEWDLDAGRVTWSPEMFRLFGMGLRESGGDGPSPQQVMQLVHPADRGRALALTRQLLKAGGRTKYQLRTLGADGSERHAEGWVETRRDAAGRTTRAWGTLQDVTERVTRDAALAESEERLRLTIETSPVGFALVARDGRWTEVNEAMARMVGYTRENLMQMRFQDITHPDDLDTDLALVAELDSGKRDSYQLDKRYLHSNGQVVWARLTASVVRRVDGTPSHYVSQVEDITERRRATIELQAERDLSAALLGALHDGYAYLERGMIVVVNDVFCEMTGTSREQLIGTSELSTLLNRHAAGTAGAPLRELINFREGNVELPITRADGSVFEAAIQIRPVRRGEGRVSGYVVLIRDITDRKQHERRLRHRADHDGLTGLLNRGAFYVRLAERYASARASGTPLSLAIIDLDGFKSVNDTYGHPAGDTVLVEFADRLRGNARGDDIIGRIGGEEFGWVMGDTAADEALGALNRTLESVRRFPFSHIGRLSFSAGLVQAGELPAESMRDAGGGAGDTARALIEEADQLLYTAKAAGRDRVVAAPFEGGTVAQ